MPWSRGSLAGGAGDVDDQQTFVALKCLFKEQNFALGVSLTRANTPETPGYRGYENLLAMWGTILAVVFVFIVYGWLMGQLSVPVGIAVFLIAGRVVQKRAGSWTKRWALSSASRLRNRALQDVVERNPKIGSVCLSLTSIFMLKSRTPKSREGCFISRNGRCLQQH